MAVTTYIAEGEQLRCPRHNVLFARTGACSGCVLDPGVPPEDEPIVIPPPPQGCVSTEEVERTAVDELREVYRLRKKLSGGKTRKGKSDEDEPVVLDMHAYNTIAKYTEVGLKLMRFIHECAARREDEAVVHERERRKRAMEGSAPH